MATKIPICVSVTEDSDGRVAKTFQEVIGKEDKHNPLTDEQLVTVLNTHGYPIARRTVAKYRDQLGIPVARMRKSL